VSPEDRAKAVVEHFPELAEHRRKELERVVTGAIRRGIAQELARLEKLQLAAVETAKGIGKARKFQNPAGLDYHGKFAEELRAAQYRAMGKVPPRESDFANLKRIGRFLKSG
jgi:hypothetical protein